MPLPLLLRPALRCAPRLCLVRRASSASRDDDALALWPWKPQPGLRVHKRFACALTLSLARCAVGPAAFGVMEAAARASAVAPAGVHRPRRSRHSRNLAASRSAFSGGSGSSCALFAAPQHAQRSRAVSAGVSAVLTPPGPAPADEEKDEVRARRAEQCSILEQE